MPATVTQRYTLNPMPALWRWTALQFLALTAACFLLPEAATLGNVAMALWAVAVLAYLVNMARRLTTPPRVDHSIDRPTVTFKIDVSDDTPPALAKAQQHVNASLWQAAQAISTRLGPEGWTSATVTTTRKTALPSGVSSETAKQVNDYLAAVAMSAKGEATAKVVEEARDAYLAECGRRGIRPLSHEGRQLAKDWHAPPGPQNVGEAAHGKPADSQGKPKKIGRDVVE